MDRHCGIIIIYSRHCRLLYKHTGHEADSDVTTPELHKKKKRR